jgi:hypothetical protein
METLLLQHRQGPRISSQQKIQFPVDSPIPVLLGSWLIDVTLTKDPAMVQEQKTNNNVEVDVTHNNNVEE